MHDGPYALDYDLFTTEFEIYANCFAFNLDLSPEPRLFIICRTDYGEYICFYIADRYKTIEELSNTPADEIETAYGELQERISDKPIIHQDTKSENYVYKNEGGALKAYFIDWGFGNTAPFNYYSNQENPPTKNPHAYMVNIDRYYNYWILSNHERGLMQILSHPTPAKMAEFRVEFARYYRYSPNLNRLQNIYGEEVIDFLFEAIWDKRINDFIRIMLENCIDSEHKLELLLTAWSSLLKHGHTQMEILNINKIGYIGYFKAYKMQVDDDNIKMLIEAIISCLEQHHF
jgi:serine/threonine protein kinase